MGEFKTKFLAGTIQPQLFSLLLVTLILVVLAIVIYRRINKQKPNEAPSGLLIITEQYVMGIDNLYSDVTQGKIQKPAPYIFSLFTFLIVGNLFGLVGLEPPASSFSVTLTIGLITWIGIYVIGIMYQKLRFFKKYLNPIELIGQFSPLISISFRLFGNMIAGSTIIYLLYYFLGWIWSHIPVIGEFNMLGAIVAPVFHLYFDIFDGLVQAFVFSLLTMVYWALEAPNEEVVKVEKDTSKNDVNPTKEGIAEQLQKLRS